MKEHQLIEWKESWRDEYLRWICGFANAQGGTLIIGRNNKGDAVGLEKARKLLDGGEIPEQIARQFEQMMEDGEVERVEGKKDFVIRK